MQIFTWSNIILKACQCLSSNFHLNLQGIYGELLFIEQLQTGQSVKTWRKNAEMLRKQAWDIIEKWDIRLASELFEIFPSIIPKKYRGKSCTAEYNENGNWIICFKD